MSQDNKKSFVMYQGDGSNNVFSVPMTKGKYGTISVAFVRRGLDQYEYNPDTWGLNGGLFAWDLSGVKVYTDTATPAIGATIYDQYGVDTGDTVTAVGGATITVNTNVYTRDTLHDVDENTVLTWTGDALQIGDYIVIERTTTRTQPFEFQNNQKHIEKSDDNLERQIQEVADKVDNALLVDPTHTIDSNKMNPVEWMKTILRSVDKSVRAFRYLNGWLDYSLDDPNVADADKTWAHLLNTDNIKAIRERSKIVDNETVYWTEYQASDGTWRTLANTSEWDRRIQYAVDTADEAKSVADDAKDIAQDAKDIADSFNDRLTQAEQDASDAKDIAQDASDAVSAHITDTNNPHSVTAAQIGALPNTTKYGATLSLTIDSTTYVVTAQLKDQDGNNLGTAQTIDLPLESVVVSGSYDSATKEVVLTLQDGSIIRFSVADLVSGLQTEITALNMLDADLVDDTTSTHKFVTTTEKSTWNGKQDTISDLATIRSNAQAGKAASDTIATYGDIVTHDVAEFATATQGAKADTALQSGDNVSELVNDAGFITNAVNDLQNYTLTSDLATVATSGSYNDLSNKPTIPAAQVNSDWNANSGVAQILNKPTLATVATSGSYTDLSNKPTIPTTLAELTGDVSISSPTNGQSLQYDAILNKWKNVSSTATVGFDGITGSPEDNVALKNALDLKADVATTYTKTEVDTALSGKANTDLSNITSAGANIGNWSSNITNCITEIPQDIIAEIDMINTSATLKAGSKVYVPNGFEQDGTTPKFDEKPIESDITKSSFGVYNIMFFVKPNDDLDILLRDYCYSGTTAPTSFQGGLYAVWYDTTNNIIKRTADGGSTWTTGYSLPVFIGNSDNTHKVFNGFGYVGSTVFALPGVKGLIPNGRNSDGTLNTTPFTTASVITRTFTDTQETDLAFDGLFIGQNANYYLGNDNYLYDSTNSIQAEIVIGRCKRTSGVISNFNTKQTFRALDYSDSEYIANCAMPSDMYVDLTLGATDTNYTAPANGWFSFDARIAGAGYGVGLVYANNGHFESRSNCSGANQVCGVVIPVNKGQIITISYGPLATTNPRANLRFYYAKGTQ